MKYTELLAAAERAREKAYAPYSDFCVGAALLASDGTVYTGCNVENASYSPTCCAERVCFFCAVADGKRDFVAIAIVGAKRGERGKACSPCGVCRQVMSEFCDGSFAVVTRAPDGGETVQTLDALLPNRFSL